MYKLFKLGLIDKKLFLPVILAVFLIVTGFIYNAIPKVESAYYVEAFGVAIGFMLAGFIPCIFKYNSKVKSEKLNKSDVKDYFLFFISYGIYRAAVLIVYFTEFDTSIVSLLTIDQGLEIIVLLLINYLLMKYKYYRHNVISLLCFFVFALLVDIVSGNLVHLIAKDSLYIIVVITEGIFMCHMKYMMDKRYHKYWNIIFFQGLFYFIYMTIAIIIEIKLKGNANFIINYFTEENIKGVILLFGFSIIFSGLLQQILNVLIVYYFTSFHILLPYGINKIKVILTDENNTYEYRYFCLIPFFFEILSLLFYLEIFECNFCGLNKNTKRNILLREIKEARSKVESCDYSDNNEIEVAENLVVERGNISRELSLIKYK